MIRRPPRSNRTDTLFPYTTLFRSHDIERRFPIEGGSREPERRISGTPVTARSMGYVEIIDFAELDEIAREEELAIALRIRTGDFIHPHLPVVETSEVASEAIQQRILSCFSLGNSRTPTQDLVFLIDELVEIALRALSPGIDRASCRERG